MNSELSNGVAATLKGSGSSTKLQGGLPAAAKKKVGINEPQTCKNKGCGQTFKEKDNHETACNYHPGPAVFHDRMRGVRKIYIYIYIVHRSLFFNFFFFKNLFKILMII